MSAERQMELEIRSIEEAELDGQISHVEARNQIREIERNYRDEAIGAAEEAAMKAYNDTLDRW